MKRSIVGFVFKVLIQLYQLLLSPLLALLGVSCRFYPTCSHYASACLDKEPWPKALVKIFRRLCKCGPWHPGGVDLP